MEINFLTLKNIGRTVRFWVMAAATITMSHFLVGGCGGGSSSGGIPQKAPVALPDTYPVVIGTDLTADATDVNNPDGVLANDTDINGDAMTATLVTDLVDGVGTPVAGLTFDLNANGDGSFQVISNGLAEGEYYFTYMVSDAKGDGNTVTVTLQVNEVPVATDDTDFTVATGTGYIVDEGATLTVDCDPLGAADISILDNDTDNSNPVDTLTAYLAEDDINATGYGTLSLVEGGDGSFTFTPSLDIIPIDNSNSYEYEFTYKAYDGKHYSNAATVTIKINAKPIANTIYTGTLPNNGKTNVDLTGASETDASFDPDDYPNPLTVVATVVIDEVGTTVDLVNVNDVATFVSGATLTKRAGDFQYSLNGADAGTTFDSFTFVVNDGNLDSNTGTVYVNQTAPAPASVE